MEKKMETSIVLRACVLGSGDLVSRLIMEKMETSIVLRV